MKLFDMLVGTQCIAHTKMYMYSPSNILPQFNNYSMRDCWCCVFAPEDSGDDQDLILALDF